MHDLYNLLEIAIEIASHGHIRQRDKGGKPYILHPLAVMLSMPEEDIEGRIVAVLHDVVEDTNVTLDELYTIFPPSIVEAIDAISKRDTEVNKEYWARCKQNSIAARVKIKDMLHNSSPERISKLSEGHGKYLKKKYEEALIYFQT